MWYALKICPQCPSVPPHPPRNTFMDILRTRGFISPSTVTEDRSDGHFQMPRLLPQYGHIGLSLIVTSGFQLVGLSGSKSSVPVTQAAARVSGLDRSSLAKRRRS